MNSSIVELTKNQTRLEGMVKEQNVQISELLKNWIPRKLNMIAKLEEKEKRKLTR